MGGQTAIKRDRVRGTRIKRTAVALTAAAVAASGLPVFGGGARAATALVVAPNGSSTGDGSLAKPLSLAAALGASSRARPGDEILLRGGIYTGTYWSRISGTPAAPIVVRSYPGERAVFDNNTSPTAPLNIRGSDTWFRDFEITKSDPKRISTQTGAAPSDISRGSAGNYTAGDAMSVAGPRTKLINLVVHDNGNGIVFLDGATDSEIYGCIIYNNGFLSTDRAWGHAVYAHNKTGASKRITDTVMFNNWGNGIQAASETDNLLNLTVDGVTSFDNGSPVNVPRHNVIIAVGASSGTLDKIGVRNSTLYHRAPHGGNLRLGVSGEETNLRQNGTVAIENNSLFGGRTGLVMQGWKNATVRNNRFSVSPADPGASDMVKVYTNMVDGPSYRWDANTYVDGNTSDGSYAPAFVRARKDPVKGWTGWRGTFPQWVQATGYDGGSAFVRATTTVPEVNLRPNRYELGRGFVTVVNRGRTDVVAIDLSSIGLSSGQKYVVRDVQSLNGAPVASGVYDGSSVLVPMRSSAAMQPIGGSPTPVRHTPVDFGVFEVRPVA